MDHNASVLGKVDVEEIRRLPLRVGRIHENLGYVRGVVVPKGPDHDVLLLVEQCRRLLGTRTLHRPVPQLDQVGEVRPQVFQRLARPHGPYDEPQVVGVRKLLHVLPDPLPLLLAGDLLRDSVPFHSQHHHQVPPGDADVRRDRRPLDGRLLLGDLHEDLHPRAQMGALVPFVPRIEVIDEGAAAIFIQGKEPVPPASEIHEGGFDRRGDVYHPRLVDVPLELFPSLVLHLEIVENPVAYDGHADLLEVHPVDEHHLPRARSRRDGLFLLLFALGLFLLLSRDPLLGQGAFGTRRDLRTVYGIFLLVDLECRCFPGSGRILLPAPAPTPSASTATLPRSLGRFRHLGDLPGFPRLPLLFRVTLVLRFPRVFAIPFVGGLLLLQNRAGLRLLAPPPASAAPAASLLSTDLRGDRLCDLENFGGRLDP
jgi:hypothetical protein